MPAHLCAWGAVLWCATAGMPFLPPAGRLARTAEALTAGAVEGRRMLGILEVLDPSAPVALWALLGALLYIAGWCVASLWRRGRAIPRNGDGEAAAGQRRRAKPDRPMTAAIAALGTGIAAGVAAAAGAGPALFHLCGATGALVCGAALLRRVGPAPRVPRASAWACAAAFGLAPVLGLVAAPIDTALTALTGAPMLPEPWYVAAAAGDAAGIAVGLAVMTATGVAVLPAEAARPAGRWAAWIPLYILVLGGSSPARGVAAAVAAALLARLGVGPAWRCAALLAAQAAPVVLARGGPM